MERKSSATTVQEAKESLESACPLAAKHTARLRRRLGTGGRPRVCQRGRGCGVVARAACAAPWGGSGGGGLSRSQKRKTGEGTGGVVPYGREADREPRPCEATVAAGPPRGGCRRLHSVGARAACKGGYTTASLGSLPACNCARRRARVRESAVRPPRTRDVRATLLSRLHGGRVPRV